LIVALDGTYPLSPNVVAALLQAAAEEIQAEVATLPPDVAGWHPGPNEWCVKETLGHIIEAERRGFAGRIRLILQSPEPQLQGWDPAVVARERNDCARPTTEVLEEFRVARTDSIGLVRSLTVEEMDRGGLHPQVGYLRVRDLLHEWLHHDRNHMQQILAVTQAFVWPSMGNSTKFSQP
jgi:hypothetical protein